MLIAKSSCAACLIRIEKRLKSHKGVLKATVSIYQPYPAIVIYDPGKADWKAIEKILLSERVEARNVASKNIDEIPAVLVPENKPKAKKSGND